MAETTLIWTLRLLAFGHLVASVELYLNRHLLQTGQLCSWPLRREILPPAWRSFLDRAFKTPVFEFSLVLRPALALLLLFNPTNWCYLLLLWLAAVVQFLRTHALLQDSGDEVLMTVSTAIVLQSLPYCSALASPDFVQKATLIFIACQGILSYFTAGLCKLRAGWGRGQFLSDLLECRSIVTPEHCQALQPYKAWLGLVELQVVMMQLSSIGLFILGREFGLIFIVWSFCFHLLGSIFLGLRSFSHAYLSIYPAFLYLAYCPG